MNEGERPTNPAVQTAFRGCVLLFCCSAHRPELGFVVRTDKTNCITYIGYTLCMQCKSIFV